MLHRLRRLKSLKVSSKPNEILIVTLIYTTLIIWFFAKNFLNEYLSGDWLRFWIPNYYFFLSYVKEGIFPLWQPYQYMGLPAALHPGYMITYPLLWLVFLFNVLLNDQLSFNILGKTLELYLYVHCLIGSLGTYLLLRQRLNLSTIASFAGGFLYVFSIFALANFDPTFIGKMYLPLLIYLLISFIDRRSVLFFILWIIVNSFIFTLGYPYYQIYFVYAQLLLAIMYGLRSTITVLVGFLITGLLTASVLLPQAYYYMQAARIAESAEASFHINSSPIPTYLMNILIPQDFYFNGLLSWGTIPLIFLITGFTYLTKNKFNLWLIVVFISSLILGLGGYIGIQNLLGIPPFFLDKLRSHSQILILTFFCGVIIIAYGIDAAIKGLRNERIMTVLWTVISTLITLLLVLPLFKENYISENKDTLIVLGRFLILFLCGLILYYCITKFKSKTLVALVLLITLLECHYYYSNTEPHKLGANYNNYFTRNSLIPEIPTKDNLFRYEFWGDQFAYNSSHLRVFSASGYDGIPYAAAYDITRFSFPKNYQFANVKYIVNTQEQINPELTLIKKVSPSADKTETLFSDEEGFGLFTSNSKNTHYVYEVKNYLPRFYIPNSVVTCPSENCYKSEDPPKIVYAKENGINIVNPPRNRVTLQVTEYTPNTIQLHIDTPKETFIASSEIWDRGWSVKINDNKDTVYNVSNGFRGIVVPKGKSTVTMTYLPPYFIPGSILSSLGVLLLAMFFLLSKRKFSRKLLFS